MHSMISSFHTEIEKINEHDYGDFMRTANSYLLNLKNQVQFLDDRSINAKIEDIQDYTQFHSNWDIETTRTHILNDCQYLNEILCGQQQDWES